MVNIPMKFKRVSAAFDEAARGRLCESSGSEHSAAAESFTDLSDLVNSFLEREICEDVNHVAVVAELEKEGSNMGGGDGGDDDGDEERSGKCSESETKEKLTSLFRLGNGDDDVEAKIILMEVEKAYLELGGFSRWSSDSKRRLMAQLRGRGLEAGLCKSKWEKSGGCPSGVYEYIDVIADGKRYIVEVSLASEFEIARATNCYNSLLEGFPPIFVGRVGDVKKMVRLMCGAIKKSMKRGGIPVPPWRRLAYMQAMWLGPYKRTINDHHQVVKEASSDKAAASLGGAMRSVGFVPAVPASYFYNCRRENCGGGDSRKGSNLAAAFAVGSPMLL